MALRIGCPGWDYRSWSGPFYPVDLAVKRRFDFYATQFHTVELNATFYRLPEVSTVEGWAPKHLKDSFTHSSSARSARIA